MAKRKGFFESIVAGMVKGALEPAKQPVSRSTAHRASRVRITDVLPIGPPPGWPMLPEPPDGLIGPYAEDKVADEARTYARTTCPSCSAEQSPAPRAKKKCRSCGNDIYVRSGLRGVRYLLAESELDAFDQWRAREEQTRSVATDQEWRLRLAGAGFQIGDYDLDVVGESNYLAELAGVRAALTSDPRVFELRTSAVLVRESDNRYDRNAIRVYLHGVGVGYLAREDAIDFQPLVRGVSGSYIVQAKILGGRPDGAFVDPIGVRLIDVPEP